MADIPDDLPADFIGQGDFPPELDTVNWGAALFSYVWVWLYGLKPWIIGLTALFIVPLLLENLVVLFVSAELLPQAQAVLNPISTVLWWGVIVFFGLRANRLVWEHQQRRFVEASGDPTHPVPLWRYRRSTTFWSRLGLAIVGIGYAASVAVLIARPESRTGGLASIPSSVVPLSILFVVQRVRIARGKRQANHGIEGTP